MQCYHLSRTDVFMEKKQFSLRHRGTSEYDKLELAVHGVSELFDYF